MLNKTTYSTKALALSVVSLDPSAQPRWGDARFTPLAFHSPASSAAAAGSGLQRTDF